MLNNLKKMWIAIFFIIASCGQNTQEFTKQIVTNFKQSNIINNQETKDFLQNLKKYYMYFFNENSKEAQKYLNDVVLTANKYATGYNIKFVSDTEAINTIFYPGEKIDTFYLEKFPDFKNGKWKKNGIFVQQYNKNELKKILKFSSQKINQKFNRINDQIKFKVLDTKYNTITYWGKINGKWKILSIEILE